MGDEREVHDVSLWEMMREAWAEQGYPTARVDQTEANSIRIMLYVVARSYGIDPMIKLIQ